MKALGLTMADLFPDESGTARPAPAPRQGGHRLTVDALASAKKLPVAFLRYELGLEDESSHVVIPYHLADYSLAPRQRWRTALLAKHGSLWDNQKGEIVPYGLERLTLARESGSLVLVEGESDCWTLWYHGFAALGIPGSQMVGILRAEHLEGISKVYITQETDAAGAYFVENILARLKEIGWTGETRILSLVPVKDPSELHCKDPGKFKAAFQGALDNAEDIAKRTAPKAAAGFTLIRLGELLAEPDTPVDYLLENLLVSGTVSAVVAKPKVGKSTLARNLCMAVAHGLDFLGMKTKQGECIYLALEEVKEEVKRDFRALGGTGKDDRISLHIAPPPAEAVKALCALIRQRRPVLVVGDPLFRLAEIKEEKAYAETYAKLGPLIDVARETGTHLLLCHHSGKTPKVDAIDSPLGSTAIGGAVSTLIVLKRTETYRTIQTVQRVGPSLPETVLKFDADTHWLSLGGTRVEADREDCETAILAFLKDAPGGKMEPEITEGVEGKTKVIREALRELVKREKVTRQGEGKRGSPYVYFHFSFSCSQDIAGTREQETQKPGETRMDTERNLVPNFEPKSILVPGDSKAEKSPVVNPENGPITRAQNPSNGGSALPLPLSEPDPGAEFGNDAEMLR